MLLQRELGVIEHSLYEATVTRDAPDPPLAADISADVCVIGGGYAGLSAALELAERGYDVVLLEAQRLGWGASGRNGGQVIVGFGIEGEHAFEKQLSSDDMRKVWDISLAALHLVRERIERYEIACDFRQGYLHAATNSRKAKALFN